LIWLLTVLILTSTYTASLASTFTTSALSSSIKVRGDLAGKKVLTILELQAEVEKVQASTTAVEFHGDVTTLSFAERLKNKEFDAVVLTEPLAAYLQTTNCELQVVPHDWLHFYTGVAFSRNRTDLTELHNDVDLAVVKLQESQVLPGLADRFIHAPSGCETTETKGFTVYELRGLFYLYSGAIAVSVAIVLIGAAWNRCASYKESMTCVSFAPVEDECEEDGSVVPEGSIDVDSKGHHPTEVWTGSGWSRGHGSRGSRGADGEMLSVLREIQGDIAELRRQVDSVRRDQIMLQQQQQQSGPKPASYNPFGSPPLSAGPTSPSPVAGPLSSRHAAASLFPGDPGVMSSNAIC